MATRLRRDFEKVLGLIKTHAILHQPQRLRDSKNHIEATLVDYSAVRELIEDLLAEGIEASVPDTVRETVEAVCKLSKASLNELTELDIAKELQLDKSTTSRRIRAAIARGFLENLQDKKGRPARIVLTDQVLQDNQRILPTIDQLRNAMATDAEVLDSNTDNGCTVADETEETVPADCSNRSRFGRTKPVNLSAYVPRSGIVDQAGT